MLRVLVTGPRITDPRGGGIQRHVRTIVGAFRGDSLIRIVPFAVTSTQRVEPWSLKGIRLAWKYLVFPLFAHSCDVVHVNSSIDDRSVFRDAGFILLAKALGRSVVLQFHGGSLARLRLVLRGPVGIHCRAALKRADTVLFLSASQGKPVCDFFGLERVQYVGNYVAVPPLREPERREGTCLRVLFLGKLDERKGVIEAIEGYFLAYRPGWELRIAGWGPLVTVVEELTHGHSDARLLGYVEGRDLHEVLTWSDVLVLPSEAEGLPFAALEAAAAGTALVASDVGALGDIVQDGETGYVVPPRDSAAVSRALGMLADDWESLLRMQKNARQLVERQYSISSMRQTFADVWETAATAARRSK